MGGRFHNIVIRATHTEVKNFRASLEEKLKMKLPTESRAASIYKVPADLRQVETKAYQPNIISIGPYHHGVPRYQAMEELKWKYFHRLFHSDQQNGANLEALMKILKDLEQEARSSYAEDLKLTSDKFVEIMLIDSCFIVELFRELMKNDFRHGSFSIKRWMLPVLRRDLIMLENQLPLFILSKVFELTNINKSEIPNSSLKELALRFFDPLMSNDSDTLKQRISAASVDSKNHFLDLYRSSILPRILARGKEPHMFRSMAELKESGIKVKMAKNCRPLKVSFRKGYLNIPPLYFGDYRFTLFRNMMAFEQCHPACKPDIAMYLFFLDRLINSAKDIESLHYEGVIQHSLGGNKELARLVNKLCKEVARDVEESYLHKMVWKINCYCNNGLTQKRAKLKHNYFSNPWATISSLAAILLLYLTLLQATTGYGQSQAYMESTGFWFSLKDCFKIPLSGLSLPSKSPLVPEEEFENYKYIFLS